MVMYIIQSAILLAIAFIAGCIVGCLAHRMFGSEQEQAVVEPVGVEPAAPVVAPAPESAKPKAPEPSPAASAAPPAAKDDLKKIRGIGRQGEAKLNAAGITRYAQIAAWTARDRREWGEKLALRGRIEREKWVSQAKSLAKGGQTGAAERVEKGRGATATRTAPKTAKARKARARKG